MKPLTLLRTALAAGLVSLAVGIIALAVGQGAGSERPASTTIKPAISSVGPIEASTQLAQAPDVETPKKPAAPPVPPKADGTPDRQSTPRPPATGPAAAEKKVRLNFGGAPWEQVLNWFSDVSGLPLLMPTKPAGTFRYVDANEYTIAEAMDVLNGALYAQGSALIRSGNFLVVADIGDPLSLPVNLIPRIEPLELGRRGKNELVSVVVPLSVLSAEDVSKEVQQLLGVHGTVVPLAKVNRLILTDTAGNVQRVLALIGEMDGRADARADFRTFQVKHLAVEEVARVVGPLLGLRYDDRERRWRPERSDRGDRGDGGATAAVPAQASTMSIDVRGNKLIVSSTPDRLALVQEVLRQVDVPAGVEGQAASAALASAQVQVYPVSYVDAPSLVATLTSVLGAPSIRFTATPKGDAVVAIAPTADQDRIRRTIEQLDHDDRPLEVIPLSVLVATTAATQINTLNGVADARGQRPANAPYVEADAAKNQLLVRATPKQVADIKTILAKLGEPPAGLQGGAGGRLRVIPLPAGSSAELIQRIQEIWPRYRDNPLRIIGSPSTNPPPANKGGGPVLPDNAKPAPEGKRQPAPKSGSLRAPQSRGEPSRGELRPTRASVRPAVFRTVAYQAESGGEQARSIAPSDKSSKAPVIIAPGATGIIITSEDPQALAELDALIRSLSPGASMMEGDIRVFHLKHAGADDAVRTLDQTFNGRAAGSQFGGASAVASGPVRFVADLRLNAVIVKAPPAEMPKVEQLINVIDFAEPPASEAQSQVRMIQVHNTTAREVADVVREVFRDYLLPTSGRGDGPPGFSFRALLARPDSTSDRDRDRGAAAAARGPRVTIGVDDRSNRLVVNAPQALFEEIHQLAQALDAAALDTNRAVRVVPLHNANPQAVQQALDALFAPPGSRPQSRGTSSSSPDGGFSRGSDGGMPWWMMRGFGSGPGGSPGGDSRGGSGSFPGGDFRGGLDRGSFDRGGRRGSGGSGGFEQRGGDSATPGGRGSPGGPRSELPAPGGLQETVVHLTDYRSPTIGTANLTPLETGPPLDRPFASGHGGPGKQALAQQPPTSSPRRSTGPAAPPPAGTSQPPTPSPAQPAASQPAAEPPQGSFRSGVTAQALPDLGVIILYGPEADVQESIRVIQEIEKLSTVGEPSIRIVVLEHVNSEALAATLNQIYSRLVTSRGATATQQAAINLISLPRRNALLIVAPPERLEQIVQLAKDLDKPVTPDAVFRVFALSRAPAVQVGSTLQQFYANRPAGQTQVRVSTDVRSNSVVVGAAPDDMTEVAALIERLDVASGGAVNELRVFTLHNASADELAMILLRAIRTGGTPQGGLGAQLGQPFGGQPLGGQQLSQPGTAGLTGALGQLQQKSAALRFVLPDEKRAREVQSSILEDINVTADTRTNTLLVTAPSGSMQLIDELIQRLDSLPTAAAEIKVFPLKNADATTIVVMLQELYQAGGAPRGPAGGLVPGPSSAAFQQRAITLGAEGSEGGPLVELRFTADLRTNSVIASGSPANLLTVEAIILKLDSSDVGKRKTAVYKLRNAPSGEVATSLTNFLQGELQFQQQLAGVVSPLEQLERQVIVVAQPYTNALLVSATPRHFSEIDRIIKELDEMPPEVIIQVLIAEITLNDDEEFGVELGLQDKVWFQRGLIAPNADAFTVSPPFTPTGVTGTTNATVANPGFGFNQTGPNSLPVNNPVRPAVAAAQGITNLALGRSSSALGMGGFVFSAASETLSVMLRALQVQKRLEVLSRPQIMTQDNQLALIQVGQSIPYVTNSTINTSGGVVNTVGYRDVGIILQVKPMISPDGTVVMDVQPEISSLAPSPVVVSGGSTPVFAQVINTTRANTTVSARDGQTVVLGGLLTKTKRKEERKVPWLGDLPVLGFPFRFRTRGEEKRELLIILTPHVVRNPYDAERIKQLEAERMDWILCEAERVHGPIGVRGGMESYPYQLDAAPCPPTELVPGPMDVIPEPIESAPATGEPLPAAPGSAPPPTPRTPASPMPAPDRSTQPPGDMQGRLTPPFNAPHGQPARVGASLNSPPEAIGRFPPAPAFDNTTQPLYYTLPQSASVPNGGTAQPPPNGLAPIQVLPGGPAPLVPVGALAPLGPDPGRSPAAVIHQEALGRPQGPPSPPAETTSQGKDASRWPRLFGRRKS